MLGSEMVPCCQEIGIEMGLGERCHRLKSLLPMLACNSVAMNPGKRDDVLVQSTQLLQHDLAPALRYRVLHCLIRRLASHAVTVTLVRILSIQYYQHAL